MSTAASRLLFAKTELHDSPCKWLDVLLRDNAGDDQLLDALQQNTSVTFGSVAKIVANDIWMNADGPGCPHRSFRLAVWGRVAAEDVVAEVNAQPENGRYVTWAGIAHPIRVRCTQLGRLSVRDSPADIADSFHMLYSAQRAALAGGPPVDPALVVAAWPVIRSGLGAEYAEERAAYAEELAAWEAAQHPRLVLPPVIV
jgi:hypothetical protein